MNVIPSLRRYFSWCGKKERHANSPSNDFSEFQIDCLRAHNFYRESNAIPPLTLNKRLCEYSQEWADIMAKRRCSRNQYGENIFRSKAISKVLANDVVSSWFEGTKDYTSTETLNEPQIRNSTLTQILWKGSTMLGIGIANSRGGDVYVVANYDPPGNVLGRFADNLPPSFVIAPQTQIIEHTSTMIKGISSGELMQFQCKCLQALNEHRKNHNVPPLMLNHQLCEYAQQWAYTLAYPTSDSFDPRRNKYHGANLFFSDCPVTADDIVNFWYSEVDNYDFFNPNGSSNTKNFTQMVWKVSKQIGIGVAENENGRRYVVVNFEPIGNIEGHYKENVFPCGKNIIKPIREKRYCQMPLTASLYQHCPPPITAEQIIQFRNECFIAHNYYRKRHSVPLMVLRQFLCDYAQKWADALASEHKLYHRKSNRYGENLYWSTNKLNGSFVVKCWYDEIWDYNFKDGPFSRKSGHFSQVVWKDSVGLGIGIGQSEAGGVYVVANYDPPLTKQNNL